MTDEKPLPNRGASRLLVKLNHGLVCVQCEDFIVKGSDLQINDSKLRQATAEKKGRLPASKTNFFLDFSVVFWGDRREKGTTGR